MFTAADEKTRASGETPVGAPPAGRRDLETGTGAAESEKTAASKRLAPSSRFTGHQLFYIFFLDGLGGMTLSAGVNFAIAYVMYTTQDTSKSPIRLWQFPNTLAGDAAVTVFVQCILTWFVEMALVAFDLNQRSVQPIGFVAEPSRAWMRWLCLLPPTTSTSDSQPKRRGFSLAAVFNQVFRGFLLAAVAFLLLWPVAVGVLTAFGEKQGGDWVYSDRWTPQFFKFVLGGLLGLFTTPLMATFWLVKAGWDSQ